MEFNCLTVSGKYSKEEADEDKRYRDRRELRRGSFSRSIAFPEDIDSNKVSANFEQGILKIELQSLRPAEVKKVAIKYEVAMKRLEGKEKPKARGRKTTAELRHTVLWLETLRAALHRSQSTVDTISDYQRERCRQPAKSSGGT